MAESEVYLELRKINCNASRITLVNNQSVLTNTFSGNFPTTLKRAQKWSKVLNVPLTVIANGPLLDIEPSNTETPTGDK